MSLPGDVDFQFLQRTHSWSEARLYIDGYLCKEFVLTHTFDDPLEAICTATVLLAKGVDEVYFSWYDEPGQYDWKFTKAKSKEDLLDVSIYEYADMVGYYHQQSSTDKLVGEINFKVPRDFWITLVILEIEKIAKLLTYDNYKRNRKSHTFPWKELKELKQYT